MAIKFNKNDFSNVAFLNSLKTMQVGTILEDETGTFYYITQTKGVTTVPAEPDQRFFDDRPFLQKEGTFLGFPSGFKEKALGVVEAPTPAAPTPTAPTPTEPKKATLYGPGGQKEVVDVGSGRASELQTQGWGLTPGSFREPAAPTAPTPTPTAPTPTAPTPPSQPGTITDESGVVTGDIAAQIEKLNNLGIDTSALTEQQISSLFAMVLFTDLRAEQDKTLAPRSLSPEDLAGFLNEARAEFEPFFAEQIDLGRADFLNAIGSLTGEAQALEASQRLRFGQELRAGAEEAAEAGLAFSGIRRRAEGELRQQQMGLVSSSRRAIKRELRKQTTAFERRFGTEALRGVGGAPTIGFQGQEVVSPAFGGLMGTFEKQREVEERTRGAVLAEDEVRRRAILAGVTT